MFASTIGRSGRLAFCTVISCGKSEGYYPRPVVNVLLDSNGRKQQLPYYKDKYYILPA